MCALEGAWFRYQYDGDGGGGGQFNIIYAAPFLAHPPLLKLLNIIQYGLYMFIRKFELNLIENICKYMQSL